jgi:hypothetical protein
VDANGNLASVVEHTKLYPADDCVISEQPDGSTLKYTGKEPVSMNMWGFGPDIFRKLEPLFTSWLAENGREMKSEFYIPLVVSKLIEAKEATLKVATSSSSWFGVTYKEDKPQVVAAIAGLVKSGVYPEKLF